jgi:hypothetical protein
MTDCTKSFFAAGNHDVLNGIDRLGRFWCAGSTIRMLR